MKKRIKKIKENFSMKKLFRSLLSVVLIAAVSVFAFIVPSEEVEGATLVSAKKSTTGSPYAFYTFSYSVGTRTATSVNITFTCSGYLQYSNSKLGTGTGYGLVAGVYVGGAWRTWTLKSDSTSWTGTTSHSASATFTITGLSNTTTSLTGIQVRVLRSVTSNTPASLSATSVGNISISANASYAVEYNANGGSGAPAAQTKWYGVALTLSSTKPTRTGYTFVGWNTSSTATTSAYAAGATYSTNAALNLYAIWKKTITLAYDANGGESPPSSQSATIYNATTSTSFTAPTTKPTRAGFIFRGWGTTADATTVAYNPGDTITLSDNATLYAVWLAGTCKPFLSLDEPSNAVYS